MQCPRIVTIIGGGGKTSLLYYLLTVVNEMGLAAVGTSTTKLSSHCLSGASFFTIKSIEEGYQAVKEIIHGKEHKIIMYGQDPSNSEKMLGISSEWIEQLAMQAQETIFVVEGDGAAGKPIKGHASYEPVIPSGSSLVIVMIGIDGVGKKVNFQYAHRPHRICELVGAKPESLITIEMIAKLLFHPQGYLHNCPTESQIIFFINKVESNDQYKQAEALAKKIIDCKHPQVTGIIIGSIKKGEGVWLQG